MPPDISQGSGLLSVSPSLSLSSPLSLVIFFRKFDLPKQYIRSQNICNNFHVEGSEILSLSLLLRWGGTRRGAAVAREEEVVWRPLAMRGPHRGSCRYSGLVARTVAVGRLRCCCVRLDGADCCSWYLTMCSIWWPQWICARFVLGGSGRFVLDLLLLS